MGYGRRAILAPVVGLGDRKDKRTTSFIGSASKDSPVAVGARRVLTLCRGRGTDVCYYSIASVSLGLKWADKLFKSLWGRRMGLSTGRQVGRTMILWGCAATGRIDANQHEAGIAVAAARRHRSVLA
jgi:hypothetical protein